MENMNLYLTPMIQLPMVGFGTYLIKDADAQSYVSYALQTGYRHIDTAEAYRNERGVGLGIKKGMDELGISREEIFITTKLWPGNAAWDQKPKTYESTIEALNSSLARLDMDYVDLYLIHAPFPKEERLDQWRALLELQRLGKTRTIGVSNFGAPHIEEIKAAGLPQPDANQIELHPWSQLPDLVSYLDQNGIGVIAYSSLAPLSTWRAVEGQASAKTEAMRAEGAREDAPYKNMAKKYGVSEAQILLRWALQKGFAILPKSTSEERIRQNYDLFSFEIDDADMEAIAEMDRGEPLAWDGGDPTKVT